LKLKYTFAKTKTSQMKHTKNMTKKRLIVFAAFLGIFSGVLFTSHAVFADNYQDQINTLENENAAKQGNKNVLGIQASSLQDAISKLQSQINSLQSQIASNEVARDQTIAKITKSEADLKKQKSYLGDSLKAMYVDGSISSLEMLASSQDLDHFVDQEEYQNSVQGQIQRTLDSIKQLREQLDKDKVSLERMIAELSAMRTSVATQQAEQARILALNQSQQNELDTQIRTNNDNIDRLRAEQARLNNFGAAGTGVNCGGGYPGSTRGVNGTWGCNYGLDEGLDDWGMYNRECVSYTAFKVKASGRSMPAWGAMGVGNANQWDDNARASGIPVDRSPRRGDVAVSNAGSFGHVMYVEQVASDGSIYVSDYNQQWDGRYRIYWIDASKVAEKGLVFIHF